MFNLDIFSYFSDLSWRCCDFSDVMYERGVQQKQLEEKGDSSVFVFPYRTLISGLDLEEPINYDLLRVEGNSSSDKRPYVFVDPKAGRGPGICGSKEDSEVGIALKNGNPVYFIYFHSEPAEGQTMEKVFRGIAQFIEHIKVKNPYTQDPVLIGNCQAGWLLAIVAARYLREYVCPLILVGSPLSYWAGSGSMKYKGLLSGGSIWAALLADMNQGVFDGANLSLNFELHDGSQVIGEKMVSLFKDPRLQRKDFIKNEQWWNFFCHMTKEEIVWIIDNLFFGNKLEQGEVCVEGEYVQLCSITGPIIVFFSRGDTITPPSQAINWVQALYKDDKEFNVPIVYVVHSSCGHLGIFVSSSVARNYHQRVFDEIENITCLQPGLYNLNFEPGVETAIEKRPLDVIHFLIENNEHEQEHGILTFLSKQSEWFREVYEMTWGPCIRLVFSGAVLAGLHPMRFTRRFYCDSLFKSLNLQSKNTPIENNVFKKSEDLFMDFFVEWWKHWEDVSNRTVQCAMKTLIAFSP
ncbi:MAG: DUF3141 domain-containing protein [Patescibacteria group bacterium]